jgi:hypothetical protein
MRKLLQQLAEAEVFGAVRTRFIVDIVAPVAG